MKGFMKLTDDIDSAYQFVKGAGLILGYTIGYILAIAIVLGLVFCSIMGHLKYGNQPQTRFKDISGLQTYDAQGNMHIAP